MGASHGNYSHERSRGQEVRNGTKRAGPQPLFCLQFEFTKECGDGGIPFASFMRSGQPGIGESVAVTWPSLLKVMGAHAVIHFIVHSLLPRRRNQVLDGRA